MCPLKVVLIVRVLGRQFGEFLDRFDFTLDGARGGVRDGGNCSFT